ncbi:MAG: DUF3786 domain-containing protein [Clostridia bacterium]|nr:DUF3786 domain-containing protein [Clostridia bacterium]NCC42836.1 DUF3786 domain-containing protein [Clostridia bacterium]
MESNYEKMKNNMSKEFLRYDQESMIQKFSLEYDEQFLYITFVERKYRIDRMNGKVTWSNDSFQTENAADYNEAMTIYDVLCYSKADCHLKNEWVNIGSFSTIQGGTLQRGNDFFHGSGRYFDGKSDILKAACEKLNGRITTRGDVAYELDLFPFMPVVLRFWDSDDEFPASLQILLDKNTLDYMHYETLMFAITHLLNRVKEEMQE